MKKSIIFLSAFFLSSCHYFLEGQLEIVVTSNQTPLQGADLALYGKNDNKEIFIGNFNSDAQGQLNMPIDFSKYQSLKIVTTTKSLEKIILPSIQYVSIPHWWQEQVMKLNIDLPLIKPEIKPAVVSVQANSQFNPPEQSPPPEVISVSQLEASLMETIPVKPSLKDKSSDRLPLNATYVNTSKINTITENDVSYVVPTNFKITSQNQPVPNAKIFLGYNASQTIIKAGETGVSGEATVHFNKVTAPDIFIVKKDGFMTNVSPFIENSGSRITLDIKAGKSNDFLVENYAYGLGRGMDKTELLLNGAKQDVSTALGFLTLTQEIKQGDQLSLEQKNSTLSSISSDDLKKQMLIKSDDFVTLFLPTVKPFKPTVGFIEPNLSGLLESNMVWRRARREFFSRFINEQSFKTKIQDDLVKISNAKNDPTLNVFKKGWANSDYSKDIDLLMQIDLAENEEDPTIIGRIIAKDGKIVAEQKKSFNGTNAEQVASQLYEYLMGQLPIESYVLQQEKGVFTLNVGKKQHINKGDLFAAFIPQKFYSIPNLPAGVLKVTEVSETESKAIVRSGLDKLQSNINIRGVRTAEVNIKAK